MDRVARRRESASDRCSDEPSPDDHDSADPALFNRGGQSGLAHVLLAGSDSSASRAASRSPLIRRNLRGIALVLSRTATSKASTPSTRGGAFGPPSEASARTASLAASARLSP